ncbi:MAG: GNAT family N-acetyltransferase [Bacteroidetes bacterium]|nr:GNAT family N-acetyltransferase [Bacteroidota bacterium]
MILVRRTDGKTELEKHYEIRKSVFQEEQGISERDEVDNFDKKRECETYLAFYNGVAVVAGRWRENRAGYKLERICVLKEYRHHGIGKAIVRILMNDVPKSMPPNISAQATVSSYYEQFGFKARGESFWEAGILHRYMKYYPDLDPENTEFKGKK